MKLKDLCLFLDSAIPQSFQEGYDNSGLQIGLPDKKVVSALIALDITEEVLDEAIEKKCDVIISHHPLIFTGIKQLSGRSSSERILMKAIKKDIAIYSAHTNLDFVSNGVSRKLAEKLKLKNIRVLLPLKNKLLKLVTYIPENYLEKVRESIFKAGAGVIGNYDNCGFTTTGTGSYRGGRDSRPFTGEKGKLHFEKEIRFETILFSHLKGRVISALIDAHPYEEVAYDIYTLENECVTEGLGCIGNLVQPIGEKDFLKLLASLFSAKGIRYSKPTGRKIRRVALCGGAGGSLINDAVSSGADVFVTSDIRYHSFFDAGSSILLADIGHYESEKYSAEILHDLIIKKFPTFALRFSEINSNPINYL